MILPLVRPPVGVAAVVCELPRPPVGAAGGRPSSAAALGPRSSVPGSLLSLTAALAAAGRCSVIGGGGTSVGGGGSGATDVDVGDGSRAEMGGSTEPGAGVGSGVDSPAAAAAARQSSSIADGNRRGGGAGRSGPLAAPTVAAGAGPMAGAGSSPTPRHTARGENRSRPGSINSMGLNSTAPEGQARQRSPTQQEEIANDAKRTLGMEESRRTRGITKQSYERGGKQAARLDDVTQNTKHPHTVCH